MHIHELRTKLRLGATYRGLYRVLGGDLLSDILQILIQGSHDVCIKQALLLCRLRRINPAEPHEPPCPAQRVYISYSLNSSKGGYIGDYIGNYYRGY